MLAPGNTSPSAAPIEYPGGKKLSKIDFQSGENKSLLYIFDLWTLKGLCQCEGSLVKTSLQPSLKKRFHQNQFNYNAVLLDV